jgi:hypothetical protein
MLLIGGLVSAAGPAFADAVDGFPSDTSCCGRYATEQLEAIEQTIFPCNLPYYEWILDQCNNLHIAEWCEKVNACNAGLWPFYVIAWGTCTDKPVLYGCDAACPGVHANSCCASCAPGTPDAANGFTCQDNKCVCVASGPIVPAGRGCGTYSACGQDQYLGSCREGETCVNNVCYAVGCDGVPNSGKVDAGCGCGNPGPDACGACGGSGPDACGVCGGSGPDACGVCGGSGPDACGVCGGSGVDANGCCYYAPSDGCGVCGGDGSSCSSGGTGGTGGGGGSSDDYCDIYYGDWTWDECYDDDDCYWNCMAET